MENSVILSHVDHTLLKPFASWREMQQLLNEAVIYKTASVCIPPSYIKRARDMLPSLNICTVIGFPLGYSSASAKAAEISQGLLDGGDEFDMVINIGDVKNGDYRKVTAEIAALKKACEGKILKVIIETCYLDKDEKIALCRCVTDAGADYIKTSTGFGDGGATMDDILLFKEHIGQGVKIKAAGGIRTRQDMVDFIEAGCDRLGTSSAIKILESNETEGY